MSLEATEIFFVFLKKANQCCAGEKKKHLQMKIPSVFSVKPIFFRASKEKEEEWGVSQKI